MKKYILSLFACILFTIIASHNTFAATSASGGASAGGTIHFPSSTEEHIMCNVNERQASTSCGASFRIYKWDTELRDALSTSSGSANVTVIPDSNSGNVTIGEWTVSGGSGLPGGTITNCQKAQYYVRLGYEIKGGYGVNANPDLSYQVGLGQVNAFHDPELSSSSEWSKRQQSLQEAGGNVPYIYSPSYPYALSSSPSRLSNGQLDYQAIIDQVDSNHGLMIDIEIAAEIFNDLYYYKLLSEWDFSNVSSDVINRVASSYGVKDKRLLFNATRDGGKGVGAFCLDVQELSKAKSIGTKSGVEYSMIGNFDSGLVNSAWTQLSTSGSDTAELVLKIADYDDGPVIEDGKKVVYTSNQGNRTSIKVRLNHAIIFNLQNYRPPPNCIAPGTSTNWPEQSPAVYTDYGIYKSSGTGSEQIIASGHMDTDCTKITDSYNSSIQLFKMGDADGDAARQWKYEFKHEVILDIRNLSSSGSISYCEPIYLTNLFYGIEGDPSSYVDRSPYFTKACVTVTMDGASTTPEDTPATSTTNTCTNDGNVATATMNYGNTTGFTGVKNFSTSSGDNNRWHDTDRLYNGTVNGENHSNFIYAKPGDKIQFRHCLTVGARAVRGGSDTSRTYNYGLPANQFRLDVEVEGNSEGGERDTSTDEKYLFRNANNYNQTNYIASPVSPITYSTVRRYVNRTYVSTIRTNSLINDFGSSKLGRYTILMESPSLGTSGYDCAKLGTLDNSPANTPGYQVHGLVSAANNCNASKQNGTGVAYSDVGKIITQSMEWNYIEAWIYKHNIGPYGEGYGHGYGGDCTGCNGDNTAWSANGYYTSYEDAKASRYPHGEHTYKCHNVKCNCTTDEDGHESCDPDYQLTNTWNYNFIYNNTDYYQCRRGRLTQSGYKSNYYCDGEWTHYGTGGVVYNANRAPYDPPQSKTKYATVIIPYNFTTSVSSTSTNPSQGVSAGETVSTEIKVQVNPRNNPDVSTTPYATIMPAKSKIQIVEFILDDSVQFNTASSQKGTEGGIDEGFIKDTSNPVCSFFNQVISTNRSDGANANSSACNVIQTISRNDISVSGKGFNVQGNLDGDTFTANPITTVPDIEVGQKYCVAVGVYPADSHDQINLSNPSATVELQRGANNLSNSVNGVLTTGTYWHVSRATCRTVTKSPNFQVWNGDTRASTIDTSIMVKNVGAGLKAENTGNHTIFGSWDEHNVLASTSFKYFSSGAMFGYTPILNPTSSGLSSTSSKASGNIVRQDYCRFSPLTVANYRCNSATLSGANIYTNATVLTRLRSRYIAPILQNSTPTSASSVNETDFKDIATGNDLNNNQKTYHYIYKNGDLETSDMTISSYTLHDNEDATYIIYTPGTLTIKGNICYDYDWACANSSQGRAPNLGSPTNTNFDSRLGFNGNSAYDSTDARYKYEYQLLRSGGTSYDSIDSLPQLIIVANNINISPDVTQINAWLIATSNFTTANGTINTCNEFRNSTTGIPGTQADSTCSNQLVVNGPVFAKNLYLNRTAGAFPGFGKNEDSNDPTKQNIFNDGSVTPAEIFNFRADAYLWAYAQAQDNRQAQSTYVRELPPRY